MGTQKIYATILDITIYMEKPMDNENNNRMPILFIGHGNPMYAIETNSYTQMLSNLSNKLGRPKAILCISAHWLTSGTWVTHMDRPRTIHDFYGFPEELFAVEYTAPGSPKTAELVKACVLNQRVELDDGQWGLDHGTWAVMRHIYPQANIPIVQLSIDINQDAKYHFKIGQQLKSLREQGILIVGSGNIVHNLSKIIWKTPATPYDWAIEFDTWIKDKLLKRDFAAIVSEYSFFLAGKLSVPTPDHYFPLLYILGSVDNNDNMSFLFEEIHNGSISMRSIIFD